jgi:CheY-specific phosphatase CheX
VTIKCDCASADKIARSMLMMTDEDELGTEDIHDAIGEVANLVIGGIKSRIAESVGQVEVSIPIVMEGKEVVPAIGSDGHMVEVIAHGDNCTISFIIVYREMA